MRNKKPLIALGALALVGLIGATIAYFSNSVTLENVCTTAIYKTKTTEVFQSPSNWAPGQTVSKTITTSNEGSIPVAVRVSYTEKWEDESGNDVTSDVTAGTAIINFANQTDWATEGGYYYYKHALSAKNGNAVATTSSLISGVTLNSNANYSESCTQSGTIGAGTFSKTCTTSIDGLGQIKYILSFVVETVQYDQYASAWSTSVNITEN